MEIGKGDTPSAEYTEFYVSSKKGYGFFIRFWTPPDEDGKRFPLVLLLDNEKTFEGSSSINPERLQSIYPCFILEPVLEDAYKLMDQDVESSILSTLLETTWKYAIEKERIYIIGKGMGAVAAWHYPAQYPCVFAASIPICGMANPQFLSSIHAFPVWAVGSAGDDTVQRLETSSEKWPILTRGLQPSEKAVRFLRSIGNEDVKYTKNSYLNHKTVAALEADIIGWLFSQSLSRQYWVEFLRPGIWCIRDGMGDTAYLLTGSKKAVLIDTAMAESDIMPVLRSLTPLPIELVLTHGHWDHFYHAYEFGKIYINPADRAIIPYFSKHLPNKDFPYNRLIDLKDGETIDLGNVLLEAIQVSGHTPGSTVIMNRYSHCLFTGDAIGSGIGVLMSIPYASTLSEYAKSLLQFKRKLQDVKDYVFYGGHRMQEWGDDDQANIYNPLCEQTVDDMIGLCNKLVNGDLNQVILKKDSVEPQRYRAGYKTAAMWVEKSQVV